MLSLGFVFKIEENVYLNFKILRTCKSQIITYPDYPQTFPKELGSFKDTYML